MRTRKPGRPLGRGRKLLFWTCLAGCLWLGFESIVAAVVATAGPGLVWRLGVRRPGDGPSLLGRDPLHKAFLRDFDADLGWDRPPRGPALESSSARALVSAYGDSFTECTGPDDQTWEALLAKSLHANVINFGVSAYGPDQALLKLKRLYSRNRTPVVLFGFLSRDISRIVNVFGSARLLEETGTFLLNGRPYFMPTKPRFVLADGQLRLLENPVRTEDDFMRLVFEPGYARTFSSNDYFKNGYDLDRYSPPIFFPYALTLPRALWVRARNRGPIPDYAAMLMQDDRATHLLRAIFDEFIGMSQRDSFFGVVVLFGEADELSYYLEHGRHRRLDPVVGYLRERGYPYIDTVDILARHQRATEPAEPISLYFDPSNHHSAYAHKIIAQGIEDYLSPHLTNMAR